MAANEKTKALQLNTLLIIKSVVQHNDYVKASLYNGQFRVFMWTFHEKQAMAANGT